MKEGPLAYVLILIVIVQHARTLVPASLDVEVRCHNFETFANWTYDKGSLQPIFRVQILKDINNADSETNCTSLHHLNISSSVTHIYDTYYVNVSAMNGSNKSISAVSPQFSYRKDLPAEIRCMLDFPNVTLSVKGGQITFTFSHPYQVYKDTPTVKNLNRLYPNGCEECKNFKYRVGMDTLYDEKICKEEVCKGTFQVPGNSERYCISLNGTDLNTKSGMLCQLEESQIGWISVTIIIIVLCIMTGSFIVFGAIACSITRKTMPSLPKPLLPLGFKMHPENTMMPKDYNGQIVLPFVSHKPLFLTPKEEIPVDTPSLAAPHEGSRLRIGQAHLEEWNSNQEAMHLIELRDPCHKVWSDQSRQSGPAMEEPVENSSGSPLGCSLSGYDRPQVLEVEISPGDIVDGYGLNDHTSQIVF
ncbi:hypothetical protein COCON_G00033500 [Conger conger]|uniref:Fibronectin type-III domain-containing protein n=1 Tax=Conger conger TaxID=82655 RepID=A0A9Q1DZ42_CONCO|nr:interferon gamma receptor 1 [Conger conger]XP_061087649.1 interferon gamma receptor 1 [Conger conger]KAJ8284500.1 hypothetical protein COCON_G00033500 [Conger conger]